MTLVKSGRLRLMCRKTELCSFFQKGACKRGSACDFAHEEHDVREKPDLQRTKPCPTVAEGLRCEDPSCPFAHYAGEVRKFKPYLPVVDRDVAAKTKKRSDRAFRAGHCRSSCGAAAPPSGGQATSDASSDCTVGLHSDLGAGKGSLKLSLHGIRANAGRISDGGLDRQLPVCPGGERRPEQLMCHKKYKTRMCSFYLLGTCRKDDCTFAHGHHELNTPARSEEHSRAGSKASSRACSAEAAAPPQCWPPAPTGSTSEGASSEREPGSPGQQRPSEGDAWVPCVAELEAEQEGVECQLVVQNTFVTLVVSSTPKELRRSSSAPPGK
ncbi:unnamed protein product [Prorocentrum cordatum]|uniref:C3H1-type domain-containing protein n=1 Tax=Prorocentrum cordatum TaxID=2364126 RepID=A0ABN9R6B2_9DINO|nr:unnamed protein product [Polarella glacialis]